MSNRLNLIFILILASLLVGLSSCGEPNEGTGQDDNFDREALVITWADQHIIPSYSSFAAQCESLLLVAQKFQSDPNEQTYDALVLNFKESYFLWQLTAQYDIGKAEELSYRTFINTYPTDFAFINETIIKEGMDINLELISTASIQGFPALDFLLFGHGSSKVENLLALLEGEKHEAYREYIVRLADRIYSLTQEVLTDWTTSYRQDFINNTGNSVTSSIDKLINDYIFYFERNIRAGKVGIPAGQFSDTPLPTHVEAIFHQNINREMLLLSLEAIRQFFNGGQIGNLNEHSIKSYLDYLDNLRNADSKLSTLINNQLYLTANKIAALPIELKEQVESDPFLLLEVYDELQKLVVLFKIDMLQSMGINIDYIDADGD